jgi:hypothetical protein
VQVLELEEEVGVDQVVEDQGSGAGRQDDLVPDPLAGGLDVGEGRHGWGSGDAGIRMGEGGRGGGRGHQRSGAAGRRAGSEGPVHVHDPPPFGRGPEKVDSRATPTVSGAASGSGRGLGGTIRRRRRRAPFRPATGGPTRALRAQPRGVTAPEFQEVFPPGGGQIEDPLPGFEGEVAHQVVHEDRPVVQELEGERHVADPCRLPEHFHRDPHRLGGVGGDGGGSRGDPPVASTESDSGGASGSARRSSVHAASVVEVRRARAAAAPARRGKFTPPAPGTRPREGEAPPSSGNGSGSRRRRRRPSAAPSSSASPRRARSR